ncbi:MAG: TRAP transporter small permease [Alphaproteobacteria bacterium]
MAVPDLSDETGRAADDPPVDVPHRAARLFLSAVDGLSGLGLFLAAITVLALIGLITAELVLVHLFQQSLLFVDDVAGQLVAIFAFLAIAYCLREGTLIRVEVFYNRLNALWRPIVDIVFSLASLLFAGIIEQHLIRLVLSSHRYGVRTLSALEMPLWIPQLVLPIGGGVLILAILAEIVRDSYRLRTALNGRSEAK